MPNMLEVWFLQVPVKKINICHVATKLLDGIVPVDWQELFRHW